MKHLHYQVSGHQGDVVEVTLSRAANVRLLSPTNYRLFRLGRRCRGYGGYARRSPVTLPLPASGEWHIVVDLGGRAGRVRASVRLVS